MASERDEPLRRFRYRCQQIHSAVNIEAANGRVRDAVYGLRRERWDPRNDSTAETRDVSLPLGNLHVEVAGYARADSIDANSMSVATIAPVPTRPRWRRCCPCADTRTLSFALPLRICMVVTPFGARCNECAGESSQDANSAISQECVRTSRLMVKPTDIDLKC